jgi:hypothetical protein
MITVAVCLFTAGMIRAVGDPDGGISRDRSAGLSAGLLPLLAPSFSKVLLLALLFVEVMKVEVLSENSLRLNV